MAGKEGGVWPPRPACWAPVAAPLPHLLVSAPGKHPQARPQACGDNGSEASRSQVLDKRSPIWSQQA